MFALLFCEAAVAADISTAVASYREGRFDEATRLLQAHLAELADLRRLPADIQRALDGIPPQLAAAFYLEAAVVAFGLDERVGVSLLDRGRSKAVEAGRLFELRWHRAVTAFLQGPPDGSWMGVFRPAATGGFEQDPTVVRGNDFPKHRVDYAPGFLLPAVRRFPDDVELGLALATSNAVVVHTYLHTRNVVLRTPSPPDPPRGTQWRFGGIRVKGMIEPLERITGKGDANQNAMCRMYLGYFTLVDGGRIQALEHWKFAADTATDPRIRYIALVLQARSMWSDAGAVEALRALERARQLFPKAQTARRLMAALLYIGGQRDEAMSMNLALLSEDASDDPWWLLFRGGFELWPARLAELRTMSR